MFTDIYLVSGGIYKTSVQNHRKDQIRPKTMVTLTKFSFMLHFPCLQCSFQLILLPIFHWIPTSL